MKNKLAIYDFDDTLIRLQSADDFVRFVYSKKKTIFGIFIFNTHKILKTLKLLPGVRSKKYLLFSLKGIKKQDLERISKEYFTTRIEKNLNKKLIAKLIEDKKEYLIIIISGGYSIYLKYFAEKYKVDYLISTEISFDKFSCKGKIDGLDCMGVNKLIFLKKHINLENFDLIKSKVYTDHFSDIFLCSLVGKPQIVSFGQDITWTEHMKFKIIRSE